MGWRKVNIVEDLLSSNLTATRQIFFLHIGNLLHANDWLRQQHLDHSPSNQSSSLPIRSSLSSCGPLPTRATPNPQRAERSKQAKTLWQGKEKKSNIHKQHLSSTQKPTFKYLNPKKHQKKKLFLQLSSTIPTHLLSHQDILFSPIVFSMPHKITYQNQQCDEMMSYFSPF